MTTPCITNTMPGVRACTYRGSHDDGCDGNEYRLNADHEEIATGSECNGCAPRRATHGHVCTPCYRRVASALVVAPALARNLGKISSAITREHGGKAAFHFANMPATHIAADEIQRWLAACRGQVQHVVATPDGAAAGVMLALAVDSAQRRHPLVEGERKLKRQRCPECSMLTLVWEPPAAASLDVTVRCWNKKCGHVMDQTSYEGIGSVEGAKDRTNLAIIPDWKGKPDPVPLDLTNPEHRALLGLTA